MILEGHQRKGKRLIPPALQVGLLEEVAWMDEILPELLWIGLLNDLHGIPTAAGLCAELGKTGEGILKSSDKKLPLFRVSSYDLFTKEEKSLLTEGLRSAGMLGPIARAVAPLCSAYPKCPMAFLVDDDVDVERSILLIRGLLPQLFDRWDVAATFVQVHAVYMAFVQGRLFVREGLPLANFPAVEAYPDTEESKRIASSCRATVSMFFGRDDQGLPDWWSPYFWNRGLELEQCRPMPLEDPDDAC